MDTTNGTGFTIALSNQNHVFRMRSISKLTALWLSSLLAVLLLNGCGNKGALYLEPDDSSQRELEQAEQEINEAAQTSGSQDEADDTEESEKKKEEKEQQ